MGRKHRCCSVGTASSFAAPRDYLSRRLVKESRLISIARLCWPRGRLPPALLFSGRKDPDCFEIPHCSNRERRCCLDSSTASKKSFPEFCGNACGAETCRLGCEIAQAHFVGEAPGAISKSRRPYACVGSGR